MEKENKTPKPTILITAGESDKGGPKSPLLKSYMVVIKIPRINGETQITTYVPLSQSVDIASLLTKEELWALFEASFNTK